jgi:hypothetical protein
MCEDDQRERERALTQVAWTGNVVPRLRRKDSLE